MIEDTLEDESRKQGRPVDEAMVVEVLKRLGPPVKMASSYMPTRYLIGPDLYPTFILVTRIVLTVLLILGVIGLGVSLGMSNLVASEIVKSIFQAAGGLLNSVVAAFGWIVFIFAVIEWFVVQKNLKIHQEVWDPTKLKKAPKQKGEKFNPAGLVTEVVLTILALVLFNAFPQYVGVGTIHNGQWIAVGLLAPAFFTYLPWITLLWGLKASVDIMALGLGHWTAGIRWAQVALGLGSIVLGYRILTGPDILAFPLDTITKLGWGTATSMSIQDLSTLANSVVRLSIAIAVIAEAIEATVRLFRLVFKAIQPPVVSFRN